MKVALAATTDPLLSLKIGLTAASDRFVTTITRACARRFRSPTVSFSPAEDALKRRVT